MTEKDFKKLVNETAETISEHFYDDEIKTNVEFRAKSNIDAYVIREAVGGCCDWCMKLVGKYKYGSQPNNFYQRHNNCTCLVTYVNEKGYTNVHNKKLYASQKDARIEHIKEVVEREKINKKFDKEKRILKSKGEVVYDATKEWAAKTNTKTSIVTDRNWAMFEGKRYSLGDNVILDYSNYEKLVAEKFVDTFGGIIEMKPRVTIKQGIQTADYYYKGIINADIDLKNLLDGTSKTKVYNAIHKKKGQAQNFIIDMSFSELSEEEVIRQCIEIFSEKRTYFVERLIVLKNFNFLKVFERL